MEDCVKRSKGIDMEWNVNWRKGFQSKKSAGNLKVRESKLTERAKKLKFAMKIKFKEDKFDWKLKFHWNVNVCENKE